MVSTCSGLPGVCAVQQIDRAMTAQWLGPSQPVAPRGTRDLPQRKTGALTGRGGEFALRAGCGILWLVSGVSGGIAHCVRGTRFDKSSPFTIIEGALAI